MSARSLQNCLGEGVWDSAAAPNMESESTHIPLKWLLEHSEKVFMIIEYSMIDGWKLTRHGRRQKVDRRLELGATAANENLGGLHHKVYAEEIFRKRLLRCRSSVQISVMLAVS